MGVLEKPPVPRAGRGIGKEPAFEFEFQDEWRARAAADELKCLGYGVEESHSRFLTRTWYVNASGVPEGTSLAAAEAAFTSWAEIRGGEYMRVDRPRTRTQAFCTAAAIVGAELLARLVGMDTDFFPTHLLAVLVGTIAGLAVASLVEPPYELPATLPRG
jgi:hypothetical protein